MHDFDHRTGYRGAGRVDHAAADTADINGLLRYYGSREDERE
jgi:hypothetical protein